MDKKFIGSHVSLEEWAQVKARAVEAEMSICAYIRTQLGFPPAMNKYFQTKPHDPHVRKEEGE